MADKKPIIIKKVVKGGHGGHHGGSWKIAYADLVTAMMAFFLLMWLLNSTSQEAKEQLALYFQEFSVFEGAPSGMGVVGSSGGGEDTRAQSQPMMPEQPVGLTEQGPSQKELLREALADMIKERLGAYKNDLLVDTFENGARIQMVHSEGNQFFESGSARLTDHGRKVLRGIADTVRELPNQLAVEGHTDAKPLGGDRATRYTNWELSTDRASSARMFLEEIGIDPNRIRRVVGYAATQPLIQDNPLDPRNRRVSILVFNASASRSNQPRNDPASDAPDAPFPRDKMLDFFPPN